MRKNYLLNFKTPTFESKILSNTPEELEMIGELERDEATKQCPDLNSTLRRQNQMLKKD